MLRTAGLAIALLFAHPAGLVHAQSNASTEARQHGYEHGYRDGADRGRQDRERGLGRNFRDNDYLAGARDYDPAFGNRSTYMSGYQQGYTAGYDDGYSYYDRPGQYGQLYGRRGGNSSRGVKPHPQRARAPAGLPTRRSTPATAKASRRASRIDSRTRDRITGAPRPTGTVVPPTVRAPATETGTRRISRTASSADIRMATGGLDTRQTAAATFPIGARRAPPTRGTVQARPAERS